MKALLEALDQGAQQGRLRLLAPAFVRFVSGLGETDPRVLLACALLSEMEGRGHTCLPLAELAQGPWGALGWIPQEWETLRQAAGDVPGEVREWEQCLAASAHVGDGVPASAALAQDDEEEDTARQPLVLAHGRLYLRRYWRYEVQVAQALAQRIATVDTAQAPDPARVRHWLERLFGAPDANAAPDWQRIACAIAARGGLSVITGGPGTGKTYTAARLLILLAALQDDPSQLRIALAAPTGKAAANLKEAIQATLDGLVSGLEQKPGLAQKPGPGLALEHLRQQVERASTLHALLGAGARSRAMRHHGGNPLEVDVLLVDEASMVNLELMAALLAALPAHARLILLGDKDQLASVEAGAVLGELCHTAQDGNYREATVAYVQAASGQCIPARMRAAGSAMAQQTVMLRASHRFGGPIGKLAQAVNGGDAAGAVEILEGAGNGPARSGPLQWLQAARREDVLELALADPQQGYRPYLELLRHGPMAGMEAEHAGWAAQVLQAFDRFRLLCALREGEWGVAGLNQLLEHAMVEQAYLQRSGEWYAGRPVMVTRNDPELGVNNGDVGIALPDPMGARALRVVLRDGAATRSVLASRLTHVETAFAITVHKSQGAEYQHAALVLPPQAGMVGTRELVYTGITRARQRFTLVTPEAAAFAQAVARPSLRAGGLAEILAGLNI